jgi:hypothetical protein
MFKSLLIGAGLVLVSAASAFACTEISSATVALTGCVETEWQQTQGTGAQEFVYGTADGNFGIMVITEKDVFTMAQFRDAIVQNAINGNGGDASKVQVSASASRLSRVSRGASSNMPSTIRARR